jgi:hypothetical protein
MKRTTIALTALALALCACAGSGVKKSLSRDEPAARAAMPLVDAVEQYKIENGRYPSDLEKLVPDYAEKVDMAELEKLGLRYRPWQQSSSYRFTFRSGSLSCTWTPEEAEWACDDR